MANEVVNLTHELAAKNKYLWLGFSTTERINWRVYWTYPQYQLPNGVVITAPPIVGKSERDLFNKKLAYLGDVKCKSLVQIDGGIV